MTLYKLERGGRYVAYFTNEKVARKAIGNSNVKVTPVAADYNSSNDTYTIGSIVVKSMYVITSDSIRKGRLVMSAATMPVGNLKSLSEYFSSKAYAVSRYNNNIMKDIASKIGGNVAIYGHGALRIEKEFDNGRLKVSHNNLDGSWTVSRVDDTKEEVSLKYTKFTSGTVAALYKELDIEIDESISIQMDISVLDEFNV